MLQNQRPGPRQAGIESACAGPSVRWRPAGKDSLQRMVRPEDNLVKGLVVIGLEALRFPGPRTKLRLLKPCAAGGDDTVKQAGAYRSPEFSIDGIDERRNASFDLIL